MSELTQGQLYILAKSIKDVSLRAYMQKGKTVDLNYFEKEFGNKENFKKLKHMVFSREKLPCLICGEKKLLKKWFRLEEYFYVHTAKI